jgi:anti-sigma B factor antagonist
MEVKFEHIGDIIIARICAESLAAYNVQDFSKGISGALLPKAKVVIDMGSLKFIDSSGIGALMKFAKELTTSDGLLKICSISISVSNLFELIRVQRFFDIFDSCDDAVSSFRA